MYTTEQAEGAWPNGTRVIKAHKNKGDSHDIGALATVIGSYKSPENNMIAYFLIWDDTPGLPSCCMHVDGRLRLAESA